jgi:inositol-phosphate phosphatase/L-galactose 1-phosphate phosphatase/histidinol-phosphatase
VHAWRTMCILMGAGVMAENQNVEENYSKRSSLDATKLQEYSVFADDLANQARAVTLNYFRQGTETEIKDDGSPVTVADRECELLIRKLIRERYPEHGIRGEEFSDVGSNSGFTWVIDPIDGTKSFISGAPTFGTLLALMHKGLPVLGVIDIPGVDERWSAALNMSTMMNGQQARAQSNSQLSSSILNVISPDRFEESQQARLDKLTSLAGVCRYSSDGYAYGLLASGYIGMVVAANQQPFDYLPVVNVIEEAGGYITDWNGDALGLESDGMVIASASQSLHEQALSICRV